MSLADPNTRQGKRTPVTLKIKFKSETLEQFIERYAVDVSQGGIFIRTKEPLAVGTQMKFEFQLRDASPLIAGEGTVVWTRENDPSRPAIAPGMGVRFDRLADGSQTVLERILAEKAKQAPSRGNEGPTKPPMFTDTPTKVAPAPVQEALGLTSRRAKSDSEQTPLPPPRPFHSDADDFDEKAFEEATKVRSLEELAAQTAGLAGVGNGPQAQPGDDEPTNAKIVTPPDELAARRGGRADSTVEPPAPTSPTAERESAPGLPEPPEATRSRPPLDSPAVARTKSGEPVARTKLGIEPAKASTRAASDSVPRAVAQDSSRPVAPKRPSSAPALILLLVLVAGGAAAVWWFVLRENVAQEVAKKEPAGSAGSAVVTNPVGSGGSAGSSVAIQEGSAGSAAVEAPKGPTVDTVIASSVAKNSTVEIVGTDQKGPAPFTAKLEKDKPYKARVRAPGYVAQEIDVKGGSDKQTAKLVLKPRVITVTSEPAGADIYIDSVNTQKITPSEVTLTASQAAKPKVRLALRRPGYRPVDQSLDANAFKESDDKMTASITVKLSVRPTSSGNTGGGTSGGGTTGGGTTTSGSGATGGGTGSGSAITPSGGGTGSATTPTGGGTGSATTPPAGGGAGSATKPPAGTGTGSATTPPAGGGGAGSAAKPATGSGAAPTGSSPSAGATPSSTTGEPEPTWTK
jgi:uncharacterized protein (TIGR02266 family)